MGHFTCTSTGKIHPCQHNISGMSNNLIYLITCKMCRKQYVGHTKNSLSQRFYSHFFNIRHQKKNDAVGLRFSKPNHRGTDDLSINVLEFIRCLPNTTKSLNLRLKMGKYWIRKLMVPAPRGLNIFY